MQKILLYNWKEKLVCLLLGGALWYLIHQNLGPVPEYNSKRGEKAESARPAASHGTKASKNNSKSN
jgi:hypothetical protein